MIRRIAEYTVKAGEEEHAERAIAAFVEAVARAEPDTTYEAYRREGGRKYVHFMAFSDQTAEERHRGAPYTATFVEVLYPACEQEPRFTRLDPVA